MSYDSEFASVNLLLQSNFETRAIDSFAISLIKLERQIRRIFTFLIYQHPNFGPGDGLKLREILVNNRQMYLVNFIKGIDSIYYKSFEQIYGHPYENDYDQILEITKDRNKIFHGQLTNKKISREELIEKVEVMKNWCRTVAINFENEIGFNGFERNAYQKGKTLIKIKNEDRFRSISDYETLLKHLMR